MEQKNSRCFWFLLIVLILACIFIHIPFLMTDYFGEPDAARIANNAFRSCFNGKLEKIVSAFSAPLYTYVIYFLFKINVLNLSSTPYLMTLISLISSVIISAGLFIFLYRLTHSVWPAVCTTLFLQFNPVFWFNSIYGFPTMVSLALCMIAVICFLHALTTTGIHYKLSLISISFILFVCAVLTKIDSIFVSALFCLPIWLMDYSSKKKLLWTLLLFGITICIFVLFNYIATPLSFHTTALGKWGDWQREFSIDFGYFLSATNRAILLHSFGMFTLPLSIVGIVFLWRDKRLRTLLFWFIMTTVPLVVFWGLRDGNSGRHNLIPCVFLFCIIGLPTATRMRYLWCVLLVAMTITNYFWFPPSNSTVCPSGNIVSSSQLLAEKYERIHKTGKQLARLADWKMAVVGNGSAQPSLLYEMLNLKQDLCKKYAYSRDENTKMTRLVFRHKRRPQIIIFFHRFPLSPVLLERLDRGFVFISLWPPAIKRMQTELRLAGRGETKKDQIISLHKLMKKIARRQ